MKTFLISLILLLSVSLKQAANAEPLLPVSNTTVEKRPASGTTPTPKQVEEDDDGTPCVKDDPRPRCLFDFDEDDHVHTETGEAERTFAFPKVKVGFVADFINFDVVPYTTLEAVDWTIFGELFSINAGLASSRAIITLNYALIPILDIGPIVFGGWNLKEKEWSAGAGFSILKF